MTTDDRAHVAQEVRLLAARDARMRVEHEAKKRGPRARGTDDEDRRGDLPGRASGARRRSRIVLDRH